MPLPFIRSGLPTPNAPDTAAADWIKLDATEPPCLLDAALQQQLAAELAALPLHRRAGTETVQAALRGQLALDGHIQIALCNGTQELIRALSLLIAQPQAAMLTLEPCPDHYRHTARLLGIRHIGVPLNPDFTLNRQAVLDAAAQHNPQLIIIGYPNNPTGSAFLRSDIEQIAAAASGMVVIDESCAASDSDSFAGSAGQPENMVVVRSLDSAGFAGLNAAYALGSDSLIGALNRVLPPHPVSQITAAAAGFALRSQDAVAAQLGCLNQERNRMASELAMLDGIAVFSSAAQFITVRMPDADQACNALQHNKIAVKNLHGSHPLLHNCLRISIGAPEDNAQVLRVLRHIADEHASSKQRGSQPADLLLGKGMQKAMLLALIAAALISIILIILYFKQQA